VNDKDFKRITPVEWIINALIIDPQNPRKLIIGTEREGIQISNDGGETFVSSNIGFHHQHVADVAVDRDHPERALVVLTFDTNAFLATKDGGSSWTALGPGLKRTELRHVYAAPTGWWATLTNGGWVKYDETTRKWERAGMYASESATPVAAKTTTTKGKKTSTASAAAAKPSAPKLANFLVSDMAFGNDGWYAATAAGVLISNDHGVTWKSAGKDPLVHKPAQSVEVSSDGKEVWAIVERNLVVTSNKGASWDAQELAFAAAGNLRLHRLDDSTIFVTTNMGLYGSHDAGKTWNRAEVRELSFQSVAGSGHAVVAALQKHGLVASYDGGKSWQRVDDPVAQGFFPVVFTRRDGSILAVSATEGLLSLDTNAKSADSSGGSGMR